MLFQVGGQGTRPTFFEMAAAQELPVSLRAAMNYTFGILALRQPFFHKILDHEDEFFALLMLFLETHSLRTTDASFSEALYGLRRRALKNAISKTDTKLDPELLRHSGLKRRQRVLSVTILVILPYIKSKLLSIYNKEREARLQATLWGVDDMMPDNNYSFNQQEGTQVLGSEVTIGTSIRKRITRIIAACYPWIHTTNEGLSFAYQLLYLLDATGFYSAGLHILGIQVCRATGQELMDASSRISKIRNRDFERLLGPPWLKAVQRILLNCVYTSLDYAQSSLITAVFFFKVMEWWYDTAEEKISAPTVYPPPPPPPAPKVAEGGITLPSDRTLCPLCLQKRVNPSVVAVSGFVFCYPCVYKYISQHKRCPVTWLPAGVEHIRKLFHGM